MSPEMKNTLKAKIINNQLFYEFFDSQNIIIEILGDLVTSDKVIFFYAIYHVNTKGVTLISQNHAGYGRLETEQLAFESAFKILEEKL